MKTQAIQQLINELKQAADKAKRLGLRSSGGLHNLPGEIFDALPGTGEHTIIYDEDERENGEWGYRWKHNNGVSIFTHDPATEDHK